jgi:hypothetical protein
MIAEVIPGDKGKSTVERVKPLRNKKETHTKDKTQDAAFQRVIIVTEFDVAPCCVISPTETDNCLSTPSQGNFTKKS